MNRRSLLVLAAFPLLGASLGALWVSQRPTAPAPTPSGALVALATVAAMPTVSASPELTPSPPPSTSGPTATPAPTPTAKPTAKATSAPKATPKPTKKPATPAPTAVPPIAPTAVPTAPPDPTPTPVATPKMFAKLTMLAPVTHNDHLYPTFQLTSLPGAKCILHLWHAVNFEETEVVALSATAGSDGVAPSDWLVPPKIYNYPWPYSIGPDDYYNTSAGNNRGYDSYCTLDGVKANIIRSFRWTADGPTPL